MVFGTRPEAIKMAPLFLKLKESEKFEIELCITAQHREMLDQVLNIFNIKPDYDLNIMKANQSLYDVTSRILLGLNDVLQKAAPDIVLVHGDTTTTFTTSLAAYYQKIKVGHVEAGLRTGDIYSPWPEEMNRKLTGAISSFHFAPTQKAFENLTKENIPEKQITITGNTVIDALHNVVNKLDSDKSLETKILSALSKHFKNNIEDIIQQDYVLITGHRRENFGEGFLNICNAIKTLANKFTDVNFIYPVHLNPNVQKPVMEILSGQENVFLIPPQDYLPFVYLMKNSKLLLTDSGGIQEEAPGLGKPVLVMRNTTERPEAVESGTVKLVGTNADEIIKQVSVLLTDKEAYNKMAEANNPFGDGNASEKIITFLNENLQN